jgi:hypothetical protein
VTTGTVNRNRIGEIRELTGEELDLVSGGGISLSYKELGIRYTPQKDDGVLDAK